jgi:RNA polymerase subunit RPABC4/transcription elongation factor Spt4
MDQILQTIGDAIGSIFDNPVVQLGFQLLTIYWIVLWIAAAYWAFRDMQGRTDNPLAPYLAAAFIIIFSPILFPLAVFTYRIVRPQERIGEVYERNLAEEAMLAEIEAIPHCPSCERRVDPAWLICPTCRTRLNRVCPNCTRLVGLDWSLCAWCGREFERHDAIAASTASVTTARKPIVSIPTREALSAGEAASVARRLRTSVRGALRSTDQHSEP